VDVVDSLIHYAAKSNLLTSLCQPETYKIRPDQARRMRNRRKLKKQSDKLVIPKTKPVSVTVKNDNKKQRVVDVIPENVLVTLTYKKSKEKQYVTQDCAREIDQKGVKAMKKDQNPLSSLSPHTPLSLLSPKPDGSFIYAARRDARADYMESMNKCQDLFTQSLLHPPLAKEAFNEFWGWYPRKISKEKSRRLFISLLKGREGTIEEFYDGLGRYLAWIEKNNVKELYIASLANWLQDRRWEDEFNMEERTNHEQRSSTKETNFDRAARSMLEEYYEHTG
jgi:hypothetical protein